MKTEKESYEISLEEAIELLDKAYATIMDDDVIAYGRVHYEEEGGDCFYEFTDNYDETVYFEKAKNQVVKCSGYTMSLVDTEGETREMELLTLMPLKIQDEEKTQAGNP